MEAMTALVIADAPKKGRGGDVVSHGQWFGCHLIHQIAGYGLSGR